jgi:hypothetical protein
MADAAWQAVPRRRAARPQQRAATPPAEHTALDARSSSSSESEVDESAFGGGRGSPDLADDLLVADDVDTAADDAPRAGLERGGAWGRVPNPLWRAPLPGQLRRHARFLALPPAADVAVAGAASLAFLRQDSGAWAAAHAGRVTTGALLAALGCREPQPARRIGLPPAAAGRRHAAAAAARMREAATLGEAAPADVEAAAAAHNAAAVCEYNARLARGEADGAEEEEADADVEMAEAEEAVAASGAVIKRPKQRRAGKKGGKGSARRAALPPAPPLPPPADAAEAALRAAGAAAAAGGGAVRCAWGSAQEGGTLWALLAAFPDAQLREVGLLTLTPEAAASAALAASLPAGALATLPRLGASPDALCAWPRGSRFAPPNAGDVDDVASSSAVTTTVEEVEVIEVKNVCPFREAAFNPSAGGGKRRGAAPSRRYALSDAGPHASLPAAHVPQLQLHMACAGTRSALLVVESATKGMAVWRMARDEAYLGAMLALLASFNARFGAGEGARVLLASASGGAEPLFPASGGDGGAATAHAAFLRRNAALARGAVMLDFIAAPCRPPDADARPFLD